MVSWLLTLCPSGSVGKSWALLGLTEAWGLGLSSPWPPPPLPGPSLWLTKATEGKDVLGHVGQGPNWLALARLCWQVWYFGLFPGVVFGNTKMMEKFGGKGKSL